MPYGYGTVDKTRGVVDYKSFAYLAWQGMIKRCFSISYNRSEAYSGCYVSNEFLEFFDFKQWIEKQKGYEEKLFQLDKDLLFKGNRIYGPETCVLLPRHINLLLTNAKRIRGKYPVGVTKQDDSFGARVTLCGKTKYLGRYPTPEAAFVAYKEAKERNIKAIAKEWRNKISDAAYEALMRYEVDIND